MSKTMPNQPFRQYRNLLVTGLNDDGLPANKEKIFSTLESVMVGFNTLVEKEDKTLRIFTGYATGTDTKAIEISEDKKFKTHIIAPCYPIIVSEIFKDIPAGNIALINNLKTDEPQQVWIAAAEEAKLNLADAVILVWDGAMPKDKKDGSIRILSEAMQRMLPIIWIDAREDEAGKLFLFDLAQANPSLLLLLKSDEQWIEHAMSHFKPVEPDTLLPAVIQKLTSTIWGEDNRLLSNLNDKKIDPKSNHFVAGDVYKTFMFFFGNDKLSKLKALIYKPTANRNKEKSRGYKSEKIESLIESIKRAANYAAAKHRDQVILVHILSSFAVMGAVSGEIDWLGLGEIFWGLCEIGTLMLILFFMWRNKHSPMNAHTAWMNYRPLAEMLRYNELLHPMMATLPGLYRGVWGLSKNNQPELLRPAAWLTVQLMRENGAPSSAKETPYILSSPETQEKITNQIDKLIQEQLKYHKETEKKNESTAKHLDLWIRSIFFLVIFVVLMHLSALILKHQTPIAISILGLFDNLASYIQQQKWLLLITAFFPALAAALHGINTKLEIERTALNSKLMQEKLCNLNAALQNLQKFKSDANAKRASELRTQTKQPIIDVAYLSYTMQMRNLAIETAKTLFEEHDGWVQLLATQGLGVPA